jgi:glycosyltransferase involved in cell wall biosynthesis
VLAQNFKDYEYIIVDGLSTDKTLEIIKKYKKRVNKIISEPDTGIYEAMNKGIKAARGEYLLFLNADDVLLHENVLAIVTEQLAGSAVDVFFGQIVKLNRQTGEAVINQQTAYLNKITLLTNQPQHPASFIRRKAFAKVGLYDATLRICGDYEWFLRAFLRHKCSYRYYDFVCAVFDLGGVSNTIDYASVEKHIVLQKYYNPLWLFIYKHEFIYGKIFALIVLRGKVLKKLFRQIC